MRWRRLVSATTGPAWTGYTVALGAVALVSVFIGQVLGRMPMANVSMLYLIAVLAVAVAFGSRPAVVASVAAFLAFDFFFVDPIHTFTVSDPAEWVGLLLFLLTAIVTGQLAADQRRRAREAEQREREAVALYDVVRLIAEPDLDRALRDVAERLRRELHVAAVAIDLAEAGARTAPIAVGTGEALRVVQSARGAARVLGPGRAPTATTRGATGRWVRIIPPRPPGTAREPDGDRLHLVSIGAPERRIGRLLLVSQPGAPAFGPANDRLLSAIAAQIGLAVERARLRREATEAEILRRTDELKTAVVEADTRLQSADGATHPAAVARALLTRPDLGVTRISYVGLPEREAVGLLIDARYSGLQAETSRSATGRLNVRLRAAPEPDETDAPTMAPAPPLWQRAWARLWAGGHRVLCLLGRRPA